MKWFWNISFLSFFIENGIINKHRNYILRRCEYINSINKQKVDIFGAIPKIISYFKNKYWINSLMWIIKKNYSLSIVISTKKYEYESGFVKQGQ